MTRVNIAVGEYYHVYNRGVRGFEIVRDDDDRRRFLEGLFYLNTQHLAYDWKNEVRRAREKGLTWPELWGERELLVEIQAFCLLDNHFHLLVKEVFPGGISKFMQRFGGMLTKNFNEKYGVSGRLFQGKYQYRHIANDVDLRNVGVYIQAKNGIEQYPGNAVATLEERLVWLQSYPYSSYRHYAGGKPTKIIIDGVYEESFTTPEDYKEFTLQVLRDRLAQLEEFAI